MLVPCKVLVEPVAKLIAPIRPQVPEASLIILRTNLLLFFTVVSPRFRMRHFMHKGYAERV